MSELTQNAQRADVADSIAIADFRPCNKGHLRAFISVRIGSLIPHDFRLMETNGRKWIAAPSREYKKKDGSAGYAETVEFASIDAKREFERAILDRIENITREQ